MNLPIHLLPEAHAEHHTPVDWHDHQVGLIFSGITRSSLHVREA